MIPQEVLLEVLLEHSDFKDFEKKGNDYRDHSGAQSLTKKGLKDFKSDEFTGLFKLAKSRNLLDKARIRAGLDEFKSKQLKAKNFQTSTENSDIAKKIWEHAEVNTEQLRSEAEQYLGEHRKIPLGAYEDLMVSGFLRFNEKDNSLIYPIVNSETKFKDVRKIQRIYLNDKGEKTLKMMLGNSGKISIIPPIKQALSGVVPAFLAIEGLESALSVRSHFESSEILVTNCKANLKHVPNFLPREASVLILSDHDINKMPNQNGQTDAAHLRTVLKEKGYSVEAKMSAEPKVDANDAIQEGRLNQWLNDLIDVPEVPKKPKPTDWIWFNQNCNQWQIKKSLAATAFRETGVDLLDAEVEKKLLEFLQAPPCGNDVSISLNSQSLRDVLNLARIGSGILLTNEKIDWDLVQEKQSPSLYWITDLYGFHSIFPELITNYLKKQAKALDVDFDSAALEMLMSLSVAIGGNKLLKVDDDWEEKACLWLATVAPSGFGKTHLTSRCGGSILEDYQRQLWERSQSDLDAYELMDSEERKGRSKPVRKRFMEHSLTLEQLMVLHVDNPAGVAVVTDELRVVLDGLGQYKSGKGNDVAKLLSLWNGKSFSNPVTGQDRFIPSVYVPVSGGIQNDLLQKLVNDANTADGLAARFLFGFPRISPIPSNPYERRSTTESVLPNEREAVRKVFECTLLDREEKRIYHLQPGAQALIDEKAHHLDIIAREVSPALFSSYRKLRTYLYRFCLLLHHLQNQPDQVEISVDTVTNVLRLMSHLESNTCKAFGLVGLSIHEQRVQKVLDKLHLLGGKAKPEMIKESLRRTFGSKRECGLFLDQMAANGILRKQTDGREQFLILNTNTEVPN